MIDQQAPKFIDYPAKIEPEFRVAKLNQKSHPTAQRFRTMVGNGMKAGPNFAGHYALISWGCGSGCAQTGVVNLKTGNFVPLPGDDFIHSFHVAPSAYDFMPSSFSIDSKLFVLIGELGETKENGAFYYKLENDRITLIHKTLYYSKCADE